MYGRLFNAPSRFFLHFERIGQNLYLHICLISSSEIVIPFFSRLEICLLNNEVSSRKRENERQLKSSAMFMSARRDSVCKKESSSSLQEIADRVKPSKEGESLEVISLDIVHLRVRCWSGQLREEGEGLGAGRRPDCWLVRNVNNWPIVYALAHNPSPHIIRLSEFRSNPAKLANQRTQSYFHVARIWSNFLQNPANVYRSFSVLLLPFE